MNMHPLKKAEQNSDIKEDNSLLPGSTTEQTDCLTEVTSFSEQISTEDTELSSTDVSVAFLNKPTGEVLVKCDLHKKLEGGVRRTVSDNSLFPVEKEQPKPLFNLLPPSTHTIQQVHEAQSRSQDSLKTMTMHSIPPEEADPCAAVLLACLFCQPLDCLLASVRGCNLCVCWFCSSLCGCEASVLQPVLDLSHHCELCGCVGARCCLCDCPICDICLQATECLDLCMEISQMLYK